MLIAHPPATAPALEPPAPARPGTARAGLGLILTVALVSALLAGALGGTLGYVFAARNGVGGGGTLVGQSDGKPAPVTNRAPESLAGAVKKVLPSLVTVHAQDSRALSTGSGFIVSPDGYIVTNQHVVSETPRGRFSVQLDSGEEVSATLVGTDGVSDIAVLKIDRTGLTPITFGDSDKLAAGDPVLALGTPLGQERSVTFGIISALNRARPAPANDVNGVSAFFAAIQTDAAINHGNSGGPLVDAAGRVIGVNQQIITGGKDDKAASSGNIGIGFAVPINQARRVATEIMSTGAARRTVIGASIDPAYQGATGGAKLLAATEGGPAARAGLKAGDVLTVFAGRLVQDGPDLIAQIAKAGPGAVVAIEFQRDGAKRTAQLTLAADSK
ncbi:trypsin-like peptidase domain-containing protein [Longispora sp. NPDC051575]|uniref:S1C family serine protease n=1 Tax=Longispora sp. NPDC051575 TaxID=3154943 RepID=UPI0034146935